MCARSTTLLATVLALATASAAYAQISVRDLPEIARGRAERLRPKQIAALEPFWADLSLDYEENKEFLDRRIGDASRLGDSVVPMLLEKLRPTQSTTDADNLASNCRRVLQRLDPGSFVDALAELARGDHDTAKREAILLLGYAEDPQSVAVLSSLIGTANSWDRVQIVRSLRRLRAARAATDVVPLLGTDNRELRQEVLAYLAAAQADQVAPTVIQALSTEGDDRLLPKYIDYFAACVRRDAAATDALLPLLNRDRIDWQDTLHLIQALSQVSPERHEPTMRKLRDLIDSNDTSSLAVSAAVSLRALGDKNGVTRLKRTLDDKLRRRKREAALYEQRARLLFAIGDFADAADDYEKIIDYAEGAAMTRRAYLGLLKSEARRRKIQNVVKQMKASGMSPAEFERLAAEDAPFREAMGHDRVQSFLRQLRRSRAPK
ncbi:MAG: HEAT repeat domain-containing protein [Planctomycetota bacterium]|nr:HEAT repeat domain-containing protein [Planctomycetota bacterium]